MAARGLKKVLSFCEKSGFLYNTSNAECGIKYGPLGAQLKRNIVNEWWVWVSSADSWLTVVSYKYLGLGSWGGVR